MHVTTENETFPPVPSWDGGLVDELEAQLERAGKIPRREGPAASAGDVGPDGDLVGQLARPALTEAQRERAREHIRRADAKIVERRRHAAAIDAGIVPAGDLGPADELGTFGLDAGAALELELDVELSALEPYRRERLLEACAGDTPELTLAQAEAAARLIAAAAKHFRHGGRLPRRRGEP